MAEKVGLIAILDMSQFNRSFAAYTRALGQMNSQTSQAAGGMGGAFLQLGDSVNSLVDKIAIGLVTALVAAGTAITAFVASGVNLAADLEFQLDAINSILGITEVQGKAVKDAIIELGLDPDLKVTALEAAQAVELLSRNGLEVNEIIGDTGDINDSAAKATILLANAVGTDFGTAANIASSVMQVFNKDAEDMVEIVGGITGVVNNSKFTVNDYALAFINGGAAAALAGVPLDEYNTLVAAMAEETGRGMRAGTGLANFLTRLTPNTNKAADAMRELGLLTGESGNAFFDAEGNLKSFVDISKILNQTMFGTSTAMVEVGGRTAEQNAQLQAAQGEVADLQKAYDRAQDSLHDYELGLKGVNLTDDARNKKIAEQQQIMANAQAAMQPYIGRINELKSVQGELVEVTSSLTEMQRSVAFETIFGNDAMEAAIAIANEGAPAYTDVTLAMEELNLTQKEATELVEAGTTKFELLYDEIAKVDAIQQAQQRMDNLKGSMKILQGIIETVKIEIGDAFIPVLRLLTDSLRDLANDVGPLITGFFETFAGVINDTVNALIAGEKPLTAFLDALRNAGLDDLVLKIRKAVVHIYMFIKPIQLFVEKHSVAFIGALEGIGTLLASAAIAARFIAIASAIASLVNPVTALIALAAGIGAAIKTDFAGIGTAFENIVTGIQTGTLTWQTAWENLSNVGANIWAMIEPHLTTLLTNIQTWFASIDWGLIGQVMWDSLLTAGGKLGEFILPKLQELLTSIQTWFETTDWALVGQTLYDGILGTAETLGTTAGEWVTNLYVSLTEFFETADWVAIGETIITGIGNGIVAILGAMAIYMEIFYTFISSFVESADWQTIAFNLGTALFTALGQFFTGVGNVLAIWYQAFVDWVSTQDWNAIGLSIVNFVLIGLGNFALFVGETLATWFAAFTTWLAGIDWTKIGMDIVFFILDGLVLFANFAVDTLAGWWQAFGTWMDSIDWYQVGFDIVTFIIDGLKFFVVTIPDTLIEWGLAFWTWVLETDWPGMAEIAVGAIILGFETFISEVGPTLIRWWLAFVDWFDSQDWGALANKVIDGIIGGLAAGVGKIGSAISGLVQGAVDAWEAATQSESPSRVFIEKARNITDGIAEGIRGGWTDVIPEIERGVQKMGDTLTSSITSMGQMATEALIATISAGLEEGQSLLSGILDFGGGISSFASAITKRYEEAFIKPLEDSNKGLKDRQKELVSQQKGFAGDIEQLQGTITDALGTGFFEPITQTIGGLTKDQKDELKELKSLRDEALQAGDIAKANQFIARITELQNIQASAQTIIVQQAKSYADLLKLAKGETPGATPAAVLAAQQLIEKYKLQSDALQEQNFITAQIAEQQEKIRIEQEKIAAIEKQQADLKFLQQQLDFLDFIEKQGLNAQEILGGLQFGLDADLGALLQAMSGAMQQVIQTAQDELGISSPSKVFQNIARQIWQGFDKGTRDQSRSTLSTMRDMTQGLVSSVTNGLSNVTNNNQRSRTLTLEVNNSFASQPSVTDRSELELLLASFV